MLLKDIGQMAMQNNYPQDPPGMSQSVMQGPASSEFVPEQHMQELRNAMLQQQNLQQRLAQPADNSSITEEDMQRLMAIRGQVPIPQRE